MSLEVGDSAASMHQTLGCRIASFLLTAVGTTSPLERESKSDSNSIHEPRTWLGVPPIEKCVLQGLSMVLVNNLFDT